MSNRSNNQSTQSIFSKYRSLVVLSFSFFALVVALGGVTFVASKQLTEATQELQLSSEQTVLVQQLSKNLLDLNLHLKTQDEQLNDPAHNHDLPSDVHSTDNLHKISALDQSIIYTLNDIKADAEYFSNTLNTLQNGGEATLPSGEVIAVEAISTPELQQILERISAIWSPYSDLINKLLTDSHQGVVDEEMNAYLVDYTRLYNPYLQSETEAFSTHLQSLIQSGADKLRLGQILGVALALILFLAIVFGSLRQLGRADTKLIVAQRQTDDIMKTVNEGLFLIDKDLTIADQYSEQLEHILQQKNIAGRNLYDVLSSMINQSDMETLKLFIEQLYNAWVVEELIQDLNPLKQVLFSYTDTNGIVATKFLKFNFLRVTNADDTIDNVFVSVVDITKEVRLQTQIEKDREQHNRQIEMISRLLNTDGEQLVYFLQQTKRRIDAMNDILKMRDIGDLKDKARQLYRETHSLKGDASAVNLSAIVDITERQEEQLTLLQNKSTLSGNDFLPFTVALDELIDAVNFITDLTKRLRLGEKDTLPELTLDTKINRQHERFYHYAQDIAARQQKQVRLDMDAFDGQIAPERLPLYEDITMQLLKNAIVHGIESPSIRQAHNKPSEGLVSIGLERVDDTHHRLFVKDDGAGIDWEKIRQTAIENGYISAEKATNLTQSELLRLMFSSGLSTASVQDEDAGRGVGMDIVRKITQDLGGKIGVTSQPHHFSQISITFAD